MLATLLCGLLDVSADRVSLEQTNVAFSAERAGWELLGRTDQSAELELIFAVKQTNIAVLEETLFAVSDPRSSKYGQHLSNTAVHDLVAPSAQSLAAVTNLLSSHGLHWAALTPNADLISVTCRVSEAEKLLGATYNSYRHSESHYIAHRTAEYSLPNAVANAVDFVSPTVRFPPINPVPKVEALGGSLGVFPEGLRKIYSVGDTVGSGSASKNKHAVTAFLNQHYHPGDLKEFWGLFMKSVNASLPVVKEVGDEVEGTLAGTESMLDIEYINVMAAGVSSEFWGFSGKSPDNPQNEPFLKWLALVSNTSDADVPLIFSTSYGEDEASTTQETADRTNIEFMKAGVRGISLLFAR
jgi:tripeptidyl-peptidase-1